MSEELRESHSQKVLEAEGWGEGWEVAWSRLADGFTFFLSPGMCSPR